MKKSKLIKRTYRITREQDKKLKKYAKADKASESAYIRELLTNL